MGRWLVLAVMACVGCSASVGSEDGSSSTEQAVIPAGCVASTTAPLVCDSTALNQEALSEANWISLRCSAGVMPDYPSVHIASNGDKFGCLGDWIGTYSSTADWHFCCPTGAK